MNYKLYLFPSLFCLFNQRSLWYWYKLSKRYTVFWKVLWFYISKNRLFFFFSFLFASSHFRCKNTLMGHFVWWFISPVALWHWSFVLYISLCLLIVALPHLFCVLSLTSLLIVYKFYRIANYHFHLLQSLQIISVTA